MSELEIELWECEEITESLGDRLARCDLERDKFTKQIELLRSALAFYADEKNWQEDELSNPYLSYLAMIDGGKRARETLKILEEQ